jgi:hypothetical protein
VTGRWSRPGDAGRIPVTDGSTDQRSFPLRLPPDRAGNMIDKFGRVSRPV